MLFIRILRWIAGYIRVQVSGGFCERFINICVSNGLSVWNTHKRRDYIELYMPAKHYKKAAFLRRKCFVKLKIAGRFGLPFYLFKYRSRKGLVVGLAIYFAILFTMPNFIWKIEINGNDRISSQSVMQALEQMDIGIGTYIGKINGESDRNELNLLVDGIAWSSLNVVGTTLKVEMKETLDNDTNTDRQYCNIVAKCDATVENVYAQKGTALVKKGAQVKKGDLLISGTEKYSNNNTYFRHASGQVMAKTQHTVTVTLPVTHQLNIRTGRSEKRTVINFFGLKIPLFAGSIKYDYQSSTDTQWLMVNNQKMPISKTTTEFFETKKQSVIYTSSQLEEKAKEQYKIQKEELGKQTEILSEDIVCEMTDNQFVLTAKLECVEDIAQTVYFEIEESFDK